LRIGGATIKAAAVVPATSTLAEYCNVQGLIDPKLNFELRLPTTWIVAPASSSQANLARWARAASRPYRRMDLHRGTT
jgi:hypothetical protein